MKKVLSFIAMALCVIAMQAQGTISLSSLSFYPGETKQLSIELNDETAYCGFQMDLVLPQGFSVTEVINEDEELVKDITLDEARKKSSHIISYNDIGRAIRIISYSNKNATYKGTSGALVNISVKAAETVAVGSYSVELKNIEFTTPDETPTRFNNVSSTFEVKEVVSGYTATVNCGTGGEAVLSASYVNSGDPLKLFIVPNDGYKVSSLKLNGNNVNVKNNIYSIASVTENVVFDVAFAQVKPDTVVVDKIITDTLVVEKIVTDSVFVEVTDTLVVEKIDTLVVDKIITDTLVVEKIVTDTVEIEKIITDTIVVEKIVTDTIEIETIETDTIYLAEINEVPVPEITFVDGMLNISCALQGVKIFYCIDGTFPDKEYIAPVAIDKDCVVTAIAAFVSDVATKEIIGTGIGGVTDEIVSCRYFTETGVEIDEPREGINIMIITYASGKTETKKVVVRKK